MLNQPTYDKLVKMRMSAMADAYRQQTEDPTVGYRQELCANSFADSGQMRSAGNRDVINSRL